MGCAAGLLRPVVGVPLRVASALGVFGLVAVDLVPFDLVAFDLVAVDLAPFDEGAFDLVLVADVLVAAD